MFSWCDGSPSVASQRTDNRGNRSLDRREAPEPGKPGRPSFQEKTENGTCVRVLFSPLTPQTGTTRIHTQWLILRHEKLLPRVLTTSWASSSLVSPDSRYSFSKRNHTHGPLHQKAKPTDLSRSMVVHTRNRSSCVCCHPSKESTKGGAIKEPRWSTTLLTVREGRQPSEICPPTSALLAWPPHRSTRPGDPSQLHHSHSHSHVHHG